MNDDRKQELWQSYQDTDYVVRDKHVSIVIRIGIQNQDLDEFLSVNLHSEWAFLTAYNPYSNELSTEENVGRKKILIDRLKKSSYLFFDGYGESRHNDWPPEPSLLVLGIGRTDAKELAREFGQNAIVTGVKGQPAELVWCQ